MADRIKGFTVSFYNEGWLDLLREYQDPEGWFVTDIGLNEDEPGYYLGFQIRGPYGEPREVSIKMTQSFLHEVNALVDDRVVPRLNEKDAWADVTLGDFGGCTCGEDCCKSPSL